MYRQSDLTDSLTLLDPLTLLDSDSLTDSVVFWLTQFRFVWAGRLTEYAVSTVTSIQVTVLTACYGIFDVLPRVRNRGYGREHPTAAPPHHQSNQARDQCPSPTSDCLKEIQYRTPIMQRGGNGECVDADGCNSRTSQIMIDAITTMIIQMAGVIAT